MTDDAARQEAEPTGAQVEAAAASLYRTKILDEWGLDEAHWHAWGDAGDRIMREHIAPHWREHARAALIAAAGAARPVVVTRVRDDIYHALGRAAHNIPATGPNGTEILVPVIPLANVWAVLNAALGIEVQP